jgi:hypothetical protein
MAAGPTSARKHWSPDELALLRQLAARGVSAPQAAGQLGRSTGAVQQKAMELGLSLTRVNSTAWWQPGRGRHDRV